MLISGGCDSEDPHHKNLKEWNKLKRGFHCLMGNQNTNPFITNSMQSAFLICITHRSSEAPEAQTLQLHAPSAKTLAVLYLVQSCLATLTLQLPYHFSPTLPSVSELMSVRQLTLCLCLAPNPQKSPHMYTELCHFLYLNLVVSCLIQIQS